MSKKQINFDPNLLNIRKSKTLKNRRGWYCKVLKEGTIEGGDFFEKLN